MYNRCILCVFALFNISCADSVFSYAAEQLYPSLKCTIGSSNIIDKNLNNLFLTKLDIFGISSEGAYANVYKDKSGKIAYIEGAIFGEWGRKNYMYNFSTNNPNDYIVKINVYNYSAPIGAFDREKLVGGKTAVELSFKVAMCGSSGVPNILQVYDFDPLYKDAMDFLDLIKSRLN